MAELTQAQIETKLTALDTRIDTVTNAITTAGGAQYVDYKIGDKTVSGSQFLEQLIKTRELYQKRLESIPTEKTSDAPYNVQVDGEDLTDLLGDE